ncbi:unnamed protein product [Heligmosomoides polygyrus]|uniref:Alba domain-containing protein n=1 Tax=Heligmosomoides polygyrus TaxID=6339 RepID=A0A183GJZ0_HELPZ|nr:unnamed protein product [Heligmosomoides polygyrus]
MKTDEQLKTSDSERVAVSGRKAPKHSEKRVFVIVRERLPSFTLSSVARRTTTMIVGTTTTNAVVNDLVYEA